MDVGQVFVVVLLCVIVINHYVTRTRWIGVPAAFWGMQALNVVFAAVVLSSPLPGLERVPAIKLVIGMLFFLRLVHNWRMRLLWVQRAQNAEIEAEEAQQLALRQAEARQIAPPDETRP